MKPTTRIFLNPSHSFPLYHKRTLTKWALFHNKEVEDFVYIICMHLVFQFLTWTTIPTIFLFTQNQGPMPAIQRHPRDKIPCNLT